MDTLTLLHCRRSSKKYGTLAPNAEQLNAILQAGLRAPDHGHLKPYHFVVIEQSAMTKFAEYLTACVAEFNLGEEGLKKAQKISQNAPLVIGVVAKIEPNLAKVPEWEQIVTAGCATYGMQLAANSLGFETRWITNKWVNGTALRQAFGCREHDQIIALVFVGSPQEGEQITLARHPEDISSFISYLR
ncbi:nitroreductase [Pasteurellaceae bacterium Macca]|nr:nitroreductase [Pasteurellaceae bacterium Macca]